MSMSSGSALNDGQWHSVRLTSGRGRLTVALDGDEASSAHGFPASPFTKGSQLFFGGKRVNPGVEKQFQRVM